MCDPFLSGYGPFMESTWINVMHIFISDLCHHWFRLWLLPWWAPSHYLNQCWITINWTLKINLSETWIKMAQFFTTKINSKTSSATWWHHQMEKFFVLLAHCVGNSPVLVTTLHKGQWCWALIYSLTCTWINVSVNNCEAGDLRCHHAHYDITVMKGGHFFLHNIY